MYHGSFGGSHQDFIVHVVKCRTDTVGIAHHKGIAMPEQSTDDITSVPAFCRFLQNVGNIDVVGNVFRQVLFLQAGLFVFSINPFVFFVQKMPYFFQYCNGIAGFNRILAQVNEVLKKLGGVGHVKISGQYQVSGFPVVASHQRVQVFDGIATKSTIPQMSQE